MIRLWARREWRNWRGIVTALRLKAWLIPVSRYTRSTVKRIVVNRWHIPDWLEKEVIARDRRCIYCGAAFAPDSPRRFRPYWEHIISDVRIITPENIARCRLQREQGDQGSGRLA